MSPKTYRILGICLCLTGAVLAILNLTRTLNLGIKFVPVLFVILGVRQFVRARKLEQLTQP